MVQPDSGGMSVAASIECLPYHRKPPEHGGDGVDPVWSLDTDDLGPHLNLVPKDDNDHSRGWFIEPMTQMSFDAYQDALAETREDWNRL